MEFGEFQNLGSPEWQGREWSLSSQINRIPVRDFNQGRKWPDLHLVSIVVASQCWVQRLAQHPYVECVKWRNEWTRVCSGRLLWQEWRRWPDWEEPRNSSLHPSSNMGSGPSSPTTLPSNMQSCWWINPPTSFCLLRACLPSPSSSFLFLPAGQASVFLAWASQVCEKEPLQPTLLVRRWIKWISDSGPRSYISGTFWHISGCLSPPHFFPWLVQWKGGKKKIQAKSVWGKSKANAKKRMF